MTPQSSPGHASGTAIRRKARAGVAPALSAESKLRAIERAKGGDEGLPRKGHAVEHGSDQQPGKREREARAR